MKRSVQFNQKLGALTPKQAAFVLEYVRNGMNGTQAAIAVGYAPSSAHLRAKEMLDNKFVEAALHAYVNEAATRSKVTVEKVLLDLELAKNLALEPYVDSNGNIKRDLGSFLKATELQGKYLKMFSEKINLNVEGSLETRQSMNVSDLTDEAIEKMLLVYEQTRKLTTDS